MTCWQRCSVSRFPQRVAEFEDRALLYVLLRRMEDFLLLKREFYETYGFEKNRQLEYKS